MKTRLRELPWGTLLIILAYTVAVLPIHAPHRLFWLGLAVAGAYLVLARRTTIQTAQFAQAHANTPTLTLWAQAMGTTWRHRALLALPTFALLMAAQSFFIHASIVCPTLFRAYCSLNWPDGVLRVDVLALAISVVGIFFVLDHALLIALTLLAQKHLPKSASFVGGTALGLRFALACAVLSVTAVSINILEFSAYVYGNWNNDAASHRRVLETLYPAVEPLVTNGLFLSANVYNRSTFCAEFDYNVNPARCVRQMDTRPFIARQMVSALLGITLYGLLIAAVLRLTAPFSVSVTLAEKSKRGPTTDEAIAYL